MKVRVLSSILTSFALAAPAASADQPSCRWLEQNNSRIFQCSVQTLEKTAARPDDAMTDGLPDPTLPLAKQVLSQQEPIQTASRPSLLNPVDRSDSRPEPKFIVLGIGNIESDKARLKAGNDRDFAYLPTPDRLSLGVFGSEKNARRRQRQLMHLGVQSEVRPFRSPGKLAVVELPVTPPVEVEKKEKHEVTAPKQQPVSGYVQLAIAFADPTVGAFVRAVRDSQARKEAELKTDQKTETQKSKNTSKTVSGYIVASLGDSEEVLDTLASIGENDYVLLRSGPYKNRVSVGVFASLDNAFARQDYFAQYGIQLEVISRAEESVVSRQPASKPPVETSRYDQLALIPLDI
jgi:hypothetical protein